MSDGTSTTEATTGADQSRLKRRLGLVELTATGVGIILGAGIYVVIGEVAGLAGGAIWIPFLIGAVAAAFTGLSYAELSSMIPKAAASFEYTRAAFGIRVGFLAGWLIAITDVIAAAAVGLGFSGYLSTFAGVPVIPVAVGLIAVCTVVLIVGIRESVWVGVTFTLVELGGLVMVVAVAAGFWVGTDFLEIPSGVGDLVKAGTLIFFAYVGFEDMAALGEEVKDPARTMPRAIIASIVITTLVYMLVAVSAVSVLDWRLLAGSAAPLADVVEAATNDRMSRVLAAIALFATANTVLFLLLAGSRMTYGMAQAGALPRRFGSIWPRTRTPVVATLAVSGGAIAFALLGDIGMLASATNFAILCVFILVNASMVWLRFKRPDARRGFRTPLSVARVPITAVLGAGVSAFLISAIDLDVIAIGLGVVASGVVLPFVTGVFRGSAALIDTGDLGSSATQIDEPVDEPDHPGTPDDVAEGHGGQVVD